MPVEHIKPQRPKVNPKLVQSLARELKLNRLSGPSTAPHIVEEELPFGDYKHVTVIWDAWKDIDPETRGRIILGAYEKVGGPEAVLRISMALGLTRHESQRLGLPKR